jgi:hypothetical protein
MKEFYSKKEPLMLLHIVNRKKDITTKRKDLSPSNQYLQVACGKLKKGDKSKAHHHIVYSKITTITQESVVVINGSIVVTLYDIDNMFLERVVLTAGDSFITYLGGHSYKCVKDNTIIYQFKTGPYFGKTKDRVLIKGAEIND